MHHTELSIEQVAAIVEDHFHRQGDHKAKATLSKFGASFFIVTHEQQVQLPNDANATINKLLNGL